MTSPLLPVPASRRPLPALATAPLPTPALTVLRPIRSRRVRRWWPVALGVLLAGNLLLYVVTVVQEAALNRSQAEIYTMREHNLRLRAELASAESPDRVETRAAQELNMARPAGAMFLPDPPTARGLRLRTKPASFGVTEAF